MTTEEILDKKKVWLFRKVKTYDEKDVKKAMIEHTKYHVTQALKEASENARTEYDCPNWNCSGESINKNSILNAYPLEKIK